MSEIDISYMHEGMLLMFCFEQERSQFAIVSDMPMMSANPVRAFLRVSFTGVENFRRELGDLERYNSVTSSYYCKEHSGAILIQEVNVGRIANNGRLEAEFYFGTNLGSVSFEFAEMELEERRLVGTNLSGEDFYQDESTGEFADFYDPFGTSQECVSGTQ